MKGVVSERLRDAPVINEKQANQKKINECCGALAHWMAVIGGSIEK